MQTVSATSGIVEWQPSPQYHNFGDHLVWLIGERIFTPAAWARLRDDKIRRYVLLGSFICDYNIQLLLDQGYKPVLVGCGYRGDPLSADIVRQSEFLGCRGAFTKSALQQFGVNVRMVGDPAMLLPMLIRKAAPSGKSLLVPHVWDDARLNYDAADVGVDEILQATTTDMASLVRLVERISSASFVLAGAMHAAVLAHAYGVPFAFFRRQNGYIDCPPKWEDWLSSISTMVVPAIFHDSIATGISWHRQYQNLLAGNRMLPILKAYRSVGALRRGLMLKAMLWDLRRTNL